jgi:hypothetical protein
MSAPVPFTHDRVSGPLGAKLDAAGNHHYTLLLELEPLGTIPPAPYETCEARSHNYQQYRDTESSRGDAVN